MTITSKAAFAAELGVTKGRVSQYLTAGLPERSDGKLDRETCLDWLTRNARSGADHRKGPSRARTLRPQPPQPTRQLGDAEAARKAKLAMVEDVVFGIMSIACDLDLPMKVVFALVMNMQWYLSDLVADSKLSLDPRDVIKDWESIAAGQGEEPDLAGWETFRVAAYAKAGER